MTGGNGEGCVLEPVVGTRFREVEFDSRALTLGGGVDIDEETITFFEPHNFVDGQTVIYNHNNNCLLYTSPSPRDQRGSRMPSSA